MNLHGRSIELKKYDDGVLGQCRTKRWLLVVPGKSQQKKRGSILRWGSTRQTSFILAAVMGPPENLNIDGAGESYLNNNIVSTTIRMVIRFSDNRLITEGSREGRK